jgi:hypothetical protein
MEFGRKISLDNILEFCKEQCLFYVGGIKQIVGINHEATPKHQGLS